jgi:replicative DNA helicase
MDSNNIRDSYLNELVKAQNLVEKMIARDSLPGPTMFQSGIRDLDVIINGVHANELIILASKDWFYRWRLSIQLLESAIIKDSSKSILYFISRISPEDMLVRIALHLAGTDFRKVKDGFCNEKEQKRIAEVFQKPETIDLILDDYNGYSLDSIITKTTNTHRLRNVGLVVIDDYSMIKHASQSGRENKFNTSSRLKSLAQDLNIPILLLYELQSEPALGEMGLVLADVETTAENSIFHRSDLEMILHRKEEENTSGSIMDNDFWQNKEPLTLTINKNLNNYIGSLDLFYDRAIDRFMCLSNYEYD